MLLPLKQQAAKHFFELNDGQIPGVWLVEFAIQTLSKLMQKVLLRPVS